MRNGSTKKPTTKHVLRRGDLDRLEALIARAEKLAPQFRELGRDIVSSTRAATDAIISYRQVELALPETEPADPKATRMGPARKKARPQTKLTEDEWARVFKLRCAEKSLGAAANHTKADRALITRAFETDEQRYEEMDTDVFNATVPFGSNVRIDKSSGKLKRGGS